jgi:hypothetical protein
MTVEIKLGPHASADDPAKKEGPREAGLELGSPPNPAQAVLV